MMHGAVSPVCLVWEDDMKRALHSTIWCIGLSCSSSGGAEKMLGLVRGRYGKPYACIAHAMVSLEDAMDWKSVSAP